MSFIGRERELEDLKCEFAKKTSKTLIYGKRRVGKTTLILEAIKYFDGVTIYFECLQSSVRDNLDKLTRQICETLNSPSLYFNDFIELFAYLKKTDKSILIVLDEYQNLKALEAKGIVDSYFQNIIDSLGSKIHIVLSGSYVSVMKELLKKENPLFGRFTCVKNLLDMDYFDSAKFYPKCAIKEKIEYYSLFGGSPFSNSALEPDRGLKENVKKLLLNKDGILRVYINYVLLSELKKVGNANKIFAALANGKKGYGELEKTAKFTTSGLLDKTLKVLIDMQLIEKLSPINKPNDEKKSFYYVKDNLIRFYYRFIFGNEHYILTQGEDLFYKTFIENQLTQYIALRFEAVCREYFLRQMKSGNITDVLDVGKFWFDDAKNRTNAEFDLVLKHIDGSYSFYEAKYRQVPLDEKICDAEALQVKQVAEIVKMRLHKIGFVSLCGYSFTSDKYDLIKADKMFE